MDGSLNGGRTRDRTRFENTNAKLNRKTTMSANWARETPWNQFTVVAPKIRRVPSQTPPTRAKNRRPNRLSLSSRIERPAIGMPAQGDAAGNQAYWTVAHTPPAVRCESRAYRSTPL